MLVAFKEESRPTRSYFLFAFIWVVLIGSLGAVLAKPQKDIYAPQEVLSRADIVLLVDVSRSMEARSSVYAPSRMEIAQDIMTEIINKTPDARFLVFGYSSLAFSLSGFSNDYDYLFDVIEKGIYIEVIPAPGSRLPNALAAVAIEKMENPQYKNVSHVVLFSDGATINILRDDGSTERAIGLLEQANLSVVSIGVGSKDGDSIPLFDKRGRFSEEYVTLDTGVIFESFLREDMLRELSDRTGGVYFSQNDRREII
ncbi:VWA domain-containing protein, partial [Patescibacteria group bacterium]|nr:VWA domain-containing protein [Patescibacteria group bacterium]